MRLSRIKKGTRRELIGHLIAVAGILGIAYLMSGEVGTAIAVQIAKASSLTVASVVVATYYVGLLAMTAVTCKRIKETVDEAVEQMNGN